MSFKSVIFIVVCLVSFSSLSQQMNRMVLENWSNDAWENCMQQLPSYDEEGRLLVREIAHWNVDEKVWENQTKTLFNRDEDGILLNREIFKWMPDQSVWRATLRSSFSVNDKNKPTSVLNEALNEQGWQNKSIDEYKYDANGKLIEKRNERWNEQSMAWVPYSKFDYAIESNRRMGYTTYFWDNNLSKWNTYKRATYHYSKDEKVDQISYETWIDEGWKDHSVRKNIFDNEGVFNAMEVENFDLTSETWEKSKFVEYTMNDFDKLANTISKNWNNETSDWENLQRFNYSYSEEGEMIQEWSEDKNAMELFPNPATESLTIRSIPVGTLTILDALGKVVLQKENKDQTMQLDVSKWEEGVYSVQIDGNEVQKFIKQ